MSFTKEVTYSFFKTVTNAKKLSWQYIEEDVRYNVFSVDANVQYIAVIYKSGFEPLGMDIVAEAANRTDFETNFKNTANTRLSDVYTSDNFIRVTQEPREGDAKNFYSPNFCNRTTWYEGSTKVTNYSMTDSGDLTTWNTNGVHNGPWIDLYHGKLFCEDYILAANADYGVKVEVSTNGGSNWTTKTQNFFGDTATGDYDINYANGTITFNSALSSGNLVRATFAKAPSSMTWTMKPDSGKRLKLLYAEIQMTTDVEMTADIQYQTWVYNPYDLPNKVMIVNLKYKSITDLLYESTGVYPRVPAFGGTGSRGLGNKEVVIFPFNYNTARDILASQGVEIRIVTDKVHTGTFATTTLYCLQEDE